MAKKSKYDYTAKERKQAERERMKELGFKRKEYWVHEDDEVEVNAFIEKTKSKRIE